MLSAHFLIPREWVKEADPLSSREFCCAQDDKGNKSWQIGKYVFTATWSTPGAFTNGGNTLAA
jgi:hypothetical protein